MKLAVSRPEGCLSDFALDRRLAGEPDTAGADASKHIAECDRCTSRAAELERERDAFAKDGPALPSTLASASTADSPSPSPSLSLSPSPSRSSNVRRLFTGRVASALALAAAVVLFLAFRGGNSGRDGSAGGVGGVGGDGTRTKGDGAKLGFFVNHGGSVRLGGPDERVVPGDGLRFVVTAREPRYLAVLSLDGARHASTYYPATALAARVEVGSAVALPESTTLDDTLGRETIYGIFCAEIFPIEPLRVALEASGGKPPAAPGCTVDVLYVKKEAPSP